LHRAHPSQTLPHQGGGPVSALLFVLPRPLDGVGVGVMHAECVDSVENRWNFSKLIFMVAIKDEDMIMGQLAAG